MPLELDAVVCFHRQHDTTPRRGFGTIADLGFGPAWHGRSRRAWQHLSLAPGTGLRDEGGDEQEPLEAEGRERVGGRTRRGAIVARHELDVDYKPMIPATSLLVRVTSREYGEFQKTPIIGQLRTGPPLFYQLFLIRTS